MPWWVVVLGSVTLVVAAVGVPLVLVELATNPVRLGMLGARLRSLWPWRQPDAPEPDNRPVEELAVEIRRLGRVLADPGPVSAVRRLGVELAYDRVLAEACQVFGIEHHLDQPGTDRQLERLRTEAALQDMGLVLRGSVANPPRRPRQAGGAHRRRRPPAW